MVDSHEKNISRQQARGLSEPRLAVPRDYHEGVP